MTDKLHAILCAALRRLATPAIVEFSDEELARADRCQLIIQPHPHFEINHLWVVSAKWDPTPPLLECACGSASWTINTDAAVRCAACGKPR